MVRGLFLQSKAGCAHIPCSMVGGDLRNGSNHDSTKPHCTLRRAHPPPPEGSSRSSNQTAYLEVSLLAVATRSEGERKCGIAVEKEAKNEE